MLRIFAPRNSQVADFRLCLGTIYEQIKLNDAITSQGNEIRLMEGQPMGIYYGWIADGLFQTEDEVNNYAVQQGKGLGRIKYRDIDGNGIIDEADQQTGANGGFSDTHTDACIRHMGLIRAIRQRMGPFSFFFDELFGYFIKMHYICSALLEHLKQKNR